MNKEVSVRLESIEALDAVYRNLSDEWNDAEDEAQEIGHEYFKGFADGLAEALAIVRWYRE